MVEHEGRFGLGPDIDDTLGGALLPGQVISARLPPLSAVAWLALSLRDRHPAPVICVADGTRHQDILLQDLATLGGEAPACFPAWETLPVNGQQPRADIAGERMEILLRCRAGDCPPLLVTTLQALMQRTLSPDALANTTRILQVGDEAEPTRLADELQDLGYAFGLQVTDPTEAALRGGILDIWPPTEPYPVRLEFFGNTLESIRTFDPLDQRSVAREKSVRLPPATELATEGTDRLGGTLFDVLPPGVLWIRVDPEVQTHQGELLEETAAELEADAILLPVREVADRLARHPACTTLELHPLGADIEALPLGIEPLASLPALPEGTPGPDRLEAERSRWIGGLMDQRKQGESVRFYLATQGTHDRLVEQYSRAPWKVPKKSVLLGRLSQGFRVTGRALTLVTENDLYGRQKQWRGRSGSLPGRRRPKAKGRTVSDWTDLSPGELIVHLDHGIGKYLGLFEMSFNGRRQEVLSIEYDQNAKLHLPVSQAHLLTRYIGMGSRNPRLHRLGGRKWATDRFGVERAVQDLAASMLETQATRELEPGHAFDVDTPWQIEFEASFPFEETPDQHRAIEAVKEDMERPHPMDRLICGDVGYGKTEVAMRAAFKAVMNGKQVAVLVPTTILAQQHTDSFAERMAAFPFAVEMLSRYQTKGQQRVVVEGVKVGKVDIVIGTHRLLQKDIVFKDLGLLIIDEEQRFGVEQKETIKRLRTQVDVLTLTATPIPRTLYMSLLGAKEMSTIQSPPQERLPIKTLIQTYDNALVRKAVLREINRGGQVFFLHNRVQTIGKVGERLTHLIPEARIGIGHGQMGEHQLEAVMKDFIRGDLDVLLCTTIIESGVDIPNVNTMIIDRADRFGLAELYQLRGRVGRFKRQAYAYLLLPKGANLVGPARQRINALTQYAGLGSGFKLALKDLEIRGTGNLLGAEQSGHITAIGFELYCQFLKRTVARMKGESVPPLVDVDMKLDFLTFATADAERDDAAVIPLAYIEDEDLRVHAYRKLATLSSDEEVERLAEEFTDRFGPVPPALHRLLQMNRIRLLAAARDLQQVESRGEKIIFIRDGEYVKRGARFPRFTGETPDQKLEDLIRTVSGIPSGP